MPGNGQFKKGEFDPTRQAGGGARPGAGRKPDTVKAMREELRADWPSLVEKMRALTDSTDENVKLKAVTWCMEAIIGKNHEHVTIDNNLSIDVRAKLNPVVVSQIAGLLSEGSGRGG